MSLKFGHFTEEKLEISQFNSNEAAHRSIQAMMQKYEQMYRSHYEERRNVRWWLGCSNRFRRFSRITNSTEDRWTTWSSIPRPAARSIRMPWRRVFTESVWITLFRVVNQTENKWKRGYWTKNSRSDQRHRYLHRRGGRDERGWTEDYG